MDSEWAKKASGLNNKTIKRKAKRKKWDSQRWRARYKLYRTKKDDPLAAMRYDLGLSRAELAQSIQIGVLKVGHYESGLQETPRHVLLAAWALIIERGTLDEVERHRPAFLDAVHDRLDEYWPESAVLTGRRMEND